MTNTTNKTAANKNIGKVFMPIKIHMPVSVNFNAPVNLTYNGASETVADLQRYIEVTKKPVSVPSSKPTCSDKPVNNTPSSKPATKSYIPNAAIRTDCKRIDTAIRDRDVEKKCCKSAAVSETTIGDLAESLANQVNLYFDDLRKKIVEIEKELNCSTERTPIGDHFKEMIKIEQEYLQARLKYLESKKRYGF